MDDFDVTATVVESCSVVANDLDFGNYDITDPTDLDQTTTIEVLCTNTTPYTIALDIGLGAGATVADRVMAGATDTLTYSLFQDATYLTVWGETLGADTVAGVGSGVTQNVTVYGRVPALQNADPGPYSDTITVTVEF